MISAGFIGAHIKIDKGIINNGMKVIAHIRSDFSNEIWNSPSERQNTGTKGGYYFLNRNIGTMRHFEGWKSIPISG